MPIVQGEKIYKSKYEIKEFNSFMKQILKEQGAIKANI
jgi:hypothetical protein